MSSNSRNVLLQLWRSEVQNQFPGLGRPASGGCKGEPIPGLLHFLVLPACGLWPRPSSVCVRVCISSSSPSACLISLCLCLIRTPVTAFGAHLHDPWSSPHLKVIDSTTCAKSLPCKGTPTGSRDWGWVSVGLWFTTKPGRHGPPWPLAQQVCA